MVNACWGCGGIRIPGDGDTSDEPARSCGGVIEHFLTLELLGDGITADEPAGVGDGVCVGG